MVRRAGHRDGLERDRGRRHAVRRRRSGRPLQERRRRPDVGARQGPDRSPVASDMAAGRWWSLPALDRAPSERPVEDVDRHLGRRHLRDRGRRRDLGAAQQRCPGGLPARPVSRSPVSASTSWSWLPDDPDRLYQENHCGTYRSDDAGRTWVSLEDGLPSTFGFPMVTHPRDAETAYTIPLNGDSTGRYMPDGQAAVWKTTDAGATWTDLRVGLPQEGAFLTVLREAMAVDPLTPHGIYFGTTSGELFAQRRRGCARGGPSPSTCPRSPRSRRSSSTPDRPPRPRRQWRARTMIEVRLPSSLVALFPGTAARA